MVAVSSLRHVLVVGGTTGDWELLDDEGWRALLTELGKVAEHAGARWLTLHPDHVTTGAPAAHHIELPTCTVVADPSADGRARLLVAMTAVAAAGEPVTEESVSRRLNRPAEVDPDLVVVLGSNDRLPRSLVWELAYGELVYVDIPWDALQARHLEDAVSAFAARHRRFGGLD
jgi:Putative undecaprenyl diphosphate synthase